VFCLTPEGLAMIEVAPGIDIARDVLAHIAFEPIIRDVKTMDAALFQPVWGQLQAIVAKSN
jgi:propionate CoA-transferase